MISKIFAADQYVHAVKFASDYEKNGVEEMTVEQEAQIALVVLITGLVVVFAVLIVLTGIIKGYGSIVHGLGQKKKAGKTPEKEAPPALKPVQNVASAPVPAVQAGIPGEVIAAISAAVYMMDGGASTVKSIRRAPQQSNRSAWGMAGLLENTRPF